MWPCWVLRSGPPFPGSYELRADKPTFVGCVSLLPISKMTEETLRGWGFAKDKRESPSSRCLLCLETTVGQRGSQNVPCISSAAVLTAGLNCLGQKGGISAPISLPGLLLARTSCLFLSSDSKTSLPKARTPSQICLTPKPAVQSLLLQTTTYRKPTDFLPGTALPAQDCALLARAPSWTHLLSPFQTHSRYTQSSRSGDFPGGSVAKTPCSQGRRPVFNPWSGN